MSAAITTRGHGVVERLGHPHDDREGEDRQHALAGNRQARRRRQQYDGDQRHYGEDQSPQLLCSQVDCLVRTGAAA